jgi:hypothetical protein
MNIGDQVKWTHTSQRGRTVSMRLREGTYQGDAEGGLAKVRLASGSIVKVRKQLLRAPEAPTQLGEFMDAVRSAAKSQ